MKTLQTGERLDMLSRQSSKLEGRFYDIIKRLGYTVAQTMRRADSISLAMHIGEVGWTRAAWAVLAESQTS